MRLIRWLVRLLRGAGRTHGVELVLVTAETVRGRRGERLARAVRVIARDPLTGGPRPRVEVTATALDGARLGDEGDTELVLRTDARGTVGLDVLLTERVGALSIDAVGHIGAPLAVACRSEGATDAIDVELPGIATAGTEVRGRIHAYDLDGARVAGGSFRVSAVLTDDDVHTVDATLDGDGVPAFALSLEKAGAYRVHVMEMESEVVATACLRVVPEAPRAIRVLGSTDPRAGPPYGEVRVRARLEDPFGNPLPPGRLTAFDDSGAPLPTTPGGGPEAELIVRGLGHGRRVVALVDPESDVSGELSIPFAAAWLGDPGLVRVGARFTTPLFIDEPPDRAVQTATVRVSFDVERTAFEGFTPADGGFVASATASEDGVRIAIASETELTAAEHPDGLLVGALDWSCTGAGESCFTTVAAMSPEEEPWTLCVQQKEALASCICVNIIHPGTRKGRFEKIRAQAKRLAGIVSSAENVARCCPVLTVQVQESEITRADWRRITKPRRLGGLPRMLHRDSDLERLHDLVAAYRKAGCVNVVIYPTSDDAGYDGLMFKKGPMQGFGVVALDDYIKDHLTQHEIGHALGLDHVEDKDNLMWEGRSNTSRDVGESLTASQCRTIFENLSKFAC